ncbi:MAG: DUF2769 domain-containing protein [Candidatus Thorarchaeota archaeon]
MADIETWKSDTFEAKYKALMGGMSEADQKRSAQQVIHLCQCNRCPTNTETGEINAVYCTFGKREMIHEQKGCLCSECSITRTMSLRWDYYCTQGSAVELSDL